MASTVRVTETCKISPPESATESSLPLTFYDTLWLKFHPTELLFFYKLTDSSSFSNSIVPRLKQSLSLTLLHFVPFFGNLVWPSNYDKPFILCAPGDGVSLTVAESDADFDCLSGDTIREIPDSHYYVPELNVKETEAETMSLQITVFPNKGFSIGISTHHAIFDGKSIALFLKTWAFICIHTRKIDGNPTLPPELTPALDRSVIQDPEGLDTVFLNNWISKTSKSGVYNNPKSLALFSMPRSITDTNFVRGTFKLSDEDTLKIKQKALSCQLIKQDANQENLKKASTFVLTCAYVSIAIVKAKGLDSNKKLILVFPANARTRLDPPISANYFGNCLISPFLRTNVGFVTSENGLVFVIEELTRLIEGLKRVGPDMAKDEFEVFKEVDFNSTQIIGVSGWSQFKIYDTDFEWGKPKNFEVTSIDRTTTISMAERKDGIAGIEVGVVLTKDEMKIFQSLLFDGLRDL